MLVAVDSPPPLPADFFLLKMHEFKTASLFQLFTLATSNCSRIFMAFVSFHDLYNLYPISWMASKSLIWSCNSLSKDSHMAPHVGNLEVPGRQRPGPGKLGWLLQCASDVFISTIISFPKILFNNLWVFPNIIPINTIPDCKQTRLSYPCTLCPVVPRKGTVTVLHIIPFLPLCVSCRGAATWSAVWTWDLVFHFWASRPHFCIMHASFPLSSVWKKCERAIYRMYLNMCKETSGSQNFKLLAWLDGNAS